MKPLNNFVPIRITNITYETHPLIASALGGGSFMAGNYGATTKGSFIMGPATKEATEELMKQMHSSEVYLTTTTSIVQVVEEVANNLAQYLTSPYEGDRQLAETIARLKGYGNKSNKADTPE